LGYKLVLTYLQQKADLRLEARIDMNDYDESQLIEIRTPLHLPYQTTWEQFERCYGHIEIDGKSYTYVKRKLTDGFMILKCIPNTTKEVIKSTEHDLIKASQGIGQETDKASSFVKAVKCYIGDFDQDKAISGLHVLSDHHTYWPSITAFEERGFVTAYEHPPESSLFV
jgi:hypothetical protein